MGLDWRVPCAVLCVLVWASAPAFGGTYDARIRFQPGGGASAVGGYNVYVRAADEAYGAPRDAGLPPSDAGGLVTVSIDGLEARTTYIIAATAYDEQGAESSFSNELTIGYLQVAPVVDSDDDGLNDAEEDLDLDQVVDVDETDPENPDSDDDGVLDGNDRCRATPDGVAVEPDGCPLCGELRVQRIKLSAKGQKYVASGSAMVSPLPDLDVLTLGAGIEIRDDAGATLYRGEIPGGAFKSNGSGRVLKFRQRPSESVPVQANGLSKLVLRRRKDQLVVQTTASASDLDDVHAAPSLTWIFRSGNTCLRDLGLACTSKSQHAVRCR